MISGGTSRYADPPAACWPRTCTHGRELQEKITVRGSSLAWRALRIAAVIAVALACVAAVLLVLKWPFTRQAVIARLSKDTGGSVSIGRFHATYLPPGFEAAQVKIASPNTGSPAFTAQNLKVRASYPGLLFHRIGRVEIDGFQLTSAASGLTLKSEKVDAGAFVARDGVVDLSSAATGSQPFRLYVRQLEAAGAGRSRRSFSLEASSNRIPGQFHASGDLDGGLDRNSRISARFAFSQVDLSVTGGVQGILASSGQVTGSLRRLEWTGSAEVPDLHVARSAHRVDLKSKFDFTLDTSTAGFQLKSIQAAFGNTVILAHGSLDSAQTSGPDQSGKTLQLTASVDRGNVEDLLDLFSSDPRPGMTGAIRLNAGVTLPPDGAPFLRRLKIDGSFQIDHALFANPKTQRPLDYLSESSHDASRAQERRDPENIPATVRANVRDADGVARVQDVRYSMPGVNASLDGTFNLISKAIRFNGVLTTTGELPDATSPFKAVILSVARPFFGIHKKNKTTIAGFTITGTTGKPSLSLADSKMARNAAHLASR